MLPKAKALDPALGIDIVRLAMNKLDVAWDELFPQAQIVNLLVERVVVSPHDVEVQLHANGFRKVIQEIDRKNSEASIR
ncbi:MAG: hypothetical protein ACK520_10230, partial [Inhella sp.]